MNIDLNKLLRGDGCTAEDYMFIYGLVCTLRPKLIAEVGTNKGASAIIMSSAMEMFDINGQIFTCDIRKEYYEIAIREIQKAGYSNKVNVLHGQVNKLPNLMYDLAFIDGDHSYEGTKADFDYLKDKCKYILFHDVYSCEGKQQLFNELEGEKISFTGRPPGTLCDNEIKRHTSYQGFGLWKR